MTACIEYLSGADVRAALAEEVEELSDATILQKIDQLVAELEDNLGHTFGRAGHVVSTSGADTVQVTAAALIVGGDTYLFATYTTLAALEAAVNAANDTYSLELANKINPATPSTLLKALGPLSCGSTYDKRVTLCVSAMCVRLDGGYVPNLMLPLPLYSVSSVYEDGVAIASTYYWAIPGNPWITRKCCDCSTTTCRHPSGRWSNYAPGNVTVTYVPLGWGRAPSALKGALLEAYSSAIGAGPMESENWVGYSYRKGLAQARGYSDILGSGAVARYAVRFHP